MRGGSGALDVPGFWLMNVRARKRMARLFDVEQRGRETVMFYNRSFCIFELEQAK